MTTATSSTALSPDLSHSLRCSALQDSVRAIGPLFHGIITGHVFVDGNKRTASVLCASMLRELAELREPSPLQMRLLGELAVETASGGVTVEGVAFWLERIFAPGTTELG